MLNLADVHNMYEVFLKASIPSSGPYNKALLKLSYYISFNMNIPFSPSFNPDDYLPYFQLWWNHSISVTPYAYSYIDKGDSQSYILLHRPTDHIK